MCIGVPMRVIEGDDAQALCERRGAVRAVSMMLVGAQPPGTFVLTHLNSAIRVLEADDARLIDDALDALALAAEGGDVDHLFADLVGREPELPAHLRHD
ncbi:MAG: HypC/HybG/HupF family hydrogenase formation chaperone [Roseiarcus sp.]